MCTWQCWSEHERALHLYYIQDKKKSSLFSLTFSRHVTTYLLGLALLIYSLLLPTLFLRFGPQNQHRYLCNLMTRLSGGLSFDRRCKALTLGRLKTELADLNAGAREMDLELALEHAVNLWREIDKKWDSRLDSLFVSSDSDRDGNLDLHEFAAVWPGPAFSRLPRGLQN